MQFADKRLIFICFSKYLFNTRFRQAFDDLVPSIAEYHILGRTEYRFIPRKWSTANITKVIKGKIRIYL